MLKNYLIGAYLIIALLLSVVFSNYGRTANQPYSYNLGRAVVWPVSLILWSGK